MIFNFSLSRANCIKKTVVLIFLTTLSNLVAAFPSQPLTAAFCSAIPGASSTAGSPGNGGVRAYQQGSSSRPMVRVLLNQNPLSDAVCNDGSPAAIYVRKAPSIFNGRVNRNRNKWHMHLKGGGSCTSFKDCADRWCGVNSSTNRLNQPGLMSTDGTPALARGEGIFQDRSDNIFASYNQVLVYYCSSDGWIGNKPGTGLINSVRSFDPEDKGLHPSKKLDIEFRGTEIVSAAMDVLESSGGLVFSVPGPEGKKRHNLRPLNEAELFLLSGDSAGATGVRHHLDRISDRLLNNSSRKNGPTVLGALDAGAAPDLADPMIDWTATSMAQSHGHYLMKRYNQLKAFHGVVDTALDDSCVALRGYTPKCLDNHLVQKNHITTPLFQRTSLEDPVARRALVNSGLLPSALDLRVLTESSLADLEQAGVSQPAEAREPMQIMGPNCQTHIAFRHSRFFNQRSAQGETVHDNLHSFVNNCHDNNCLSLLDLDDPNNNPAGC